jgi:putative ATP-dependent endonuclease of OLD family
MNLFGHLKIDHALLHDGDASRQGNHKVFHEKVNGLIQNSRNAFTRKVHFFEEDLEAFLEYPKCKDDHRKPTRLLLVLKDDRIKSERIEELCKIVNRLIYD